MPAESQNIGSLTRELNARSEDLSSHLWIGLAGAPGSGKSTFASKLKTQLGERMIVVPMDGYHFYRHELDTMPDPALAHARRGAPFTFNAHRFVDNLKQARISGQGTFPEFHHGSGDPVEDAIQLIESPPVIVLVEGNYLLLDQPPWQQLKDQVFDETWFMDVPVEECRKRVFQRHLNVGRTAKEAQQRVDDNDGPNAELVIQSSRHLADRLIAN